MNLENIVRHEFNDLIDYMRTNDTLLYGEDDCLRLLNHTTTEEENEILEILKNLRKHLERICDIQNDCFGR
jgi:hypothetical protein